MKPVEPIQLDIERDADTFGVIAVVHKLNELIAAHNELLAKYESHHHTQDMETLDYGTVITGRPEHD